ncbi:hypothetical protein [Pseudomonas syringae]|uniref:hypothetical protein n=1 Tax=Pseudomonas syringae TaxID=317 RepID=UPI001F492D22|nr:hypothetical protein [Pseudomonas syringae]MCF5199911.1 hypothetical protein [Pseudomonas syringae]MCF5209286.1 hypothetical protein [Pseudomonas syringae]MCF5214969.1 hypothetical protein [Pseudomonas syringae]MCF5220673.1 hypothetical protein [Pseudomonas syringae]MCF5266647.1 hypothetical protein [Pseudomonas syringae]
MRIISRNGSIVFLCCQLPDYYGTSVTNAVESIKAEAIEALLRAYTDEGTAVMETVIKPGYFARLLHPRGFFDQHAKQVAIAYIRKHSMWIEHYPAGVGLAHSGSYAIVHFSENGEPSWNYVSPEYLQNQVPGIDLQVAIEKLRKWT